MYKFYFHLTKISCAVSLFQAFRLFVPDFPPFCQIDDCVNNGEVFAALEFLLTQIPLVNDSDKDISEKAWYLIEYISQLELFNCVFQ